MSDSVVTAPPAPSAASRSDLEIRLQRLYEMVLEEGDFPYIRLHAQPNSIRRQVDIFMRYAPFLPEQGAILDWGCKHAPDACMITEQFGRRYELYGLDIDPPEKFETFHRYAGVNYTQLTHPYGLPYADDMFSAVVASGVLEHVAFPSESLKELYRVMELKGVLIITFLPNRYSYSEFISRRIGYSHHNRLFTRARVRDLLLYHGFEPVYMGRHQFIPAQRGGALAERLWGVNRVLERTWPFSLFNANHIVVARKRLSI